MKAKIKKKLFGLVEPKSDDRDIARREFILNILLLSSIVLSFSALIDVTVNSLRLGSDFTGASPYVTLVVLFFFVVLYLNSRKAHPKVSAYLFVITLLAVTANASIKWGALLPQAVLMYALVIVIAGILISSRAAYGFTVLIGIFLPALAHFQFTGVLVYDGSWRGEITEFGDAIMVWITLVIIAVVSWLSNREIHKTLQRARSSEAALKVERDSLEAIVEERTRELRKAQAEKLSQLYRFAEFGRSASGYFHELANPLTAASLNLEHLQKKGVVGPHEQMADVQSGIKRALKNIKQMEGFIVQARKSVAKDETKFEFSLGQEIEEVVDVLRYRARKHKVEITISNTESLEIYGNPLKFNQIMTNLISNAIDAYPVEDENYEKRRVEVRLAKKGDGAHVSVQDWGAGIEEHIKEKIYEPLFTTKSIEEGTGLGLSIAKKIAKEGFGGEITLESNVGQGSTFTVIFPLDQNSTKKAKSK